MFRSLTAAAQLQLPSLAEGKGDFQPKAPQSQRDKFADKLKNMEGGGERDANQIDNSLSIEKTNAVLRDLLNIHDSFIQVIWGKKNTTLFSSSLYASWRWPLCCTGKPTRKSEGIL